MDGGTLNDQRLITFRRVALTATLGLFTLAVAMNTHGADLQTSSQNGPFARYSHTPVYPRHQSTGAPSFAFFAKGGIVKSRLDLPLRSVINPRNLQPTAASRYRDQVQ
jgi:hypothetical protein